MTLIHFSQCSHSDGVVQNIDETVKRQAVSCIFCFSLPSLSSHRPSAVLTVYYRNLDHDSIRQSSIGIKLNILLFTTLSVRSSLQAFSSGINLLCALWREWGSIVLYCPFLLTFDACQIFLKYSFLFQNVSENVICKLLWLISQF